MHVVVGQPGTLLFSTRTVLRQHFQLSGGATRKIRYCNVFLFTTECCILFLWSLLVLLKLGRTYWTLFHPLHWFCCWQYLLWVQILKQPYNKQSFVWYHTLLSHLFFLSMPACLQHIDMITFCWSNKILSAWQQHEATKFLPLMQQHLTRSAREKTMFVWNADAHVCGGGYVTLQWKHSGLVAHSWHSESGKHSKISYHCFRTWIPATGCDKKISVIIRKVIPG